MDAMLTAKQAQAETKRAATRLARQQRRDERKRLADEKKQIAWSLKTHVPEALAGLEDRIQRNIAVGRHEAEFSLNHKLRFPVQQAIQAKLERKGYTVTIDTRGGEGNGYDEAPWSSTDIKVAWK
jgi:uncharacterized FlaG/YvyC family protein